MSESKDTEKIPEEFTKIVYDLVNDILFTFPEYKNKLDVDLHNIKETKDQESVEVVYEHIKKILPERFFDILYKNEEMFQKEEIKCEFLPGINFSKLWKSDISEKTKETIWKYLQLLLFTVIGQVNSGESFGDSAKLFEAINEKELKGKLEETIENLQNMMGSDTPIIDISNIEHLPNPEDIQDHITGLLDGKLGSLAREIAEETAADLNFETEDATSVNDVFQKLFKNPGKLTNLVKSVGGKLDDKIKSGQINERELMQEASNLLGKMKDMPGMGDIQSMLKKMGMNPGRGNKMNTGAMQNVLNQNIKKQQARDKVREKAIKQQQEKREMMQQQQKMQAEYKPLSNEELEQLVFSIEGDKPEKTVREPASSNKKKKKKGKKK